jgi:hypothetical protein
MADSDHTYSPTSWWAESGNASAPSEYTADPGDMPGYSASTPLPGNQADPPNSKTDFPTNALNDQLTEPADYKDTDQITTTPDGIGGTQQGLDAIGAGAVPSLQQAVGATPTRTVPTAGTGDQATGGTRSGPSPALINQWHPVPMGGHLAAELTHTDASLLGALQSAGAGAGAQAALVAQTVTLDGKTVRAGGGTPVGSQGVPAASLASGSEYNTAKQFQCGPWFYPAVAAWAESHPPPAKPPPAPLNQPAPVPLGQPAPVTPEPA